MGSRQKSHQFNSTRFHSLLSSRLERNKNGKVQMIRNKYCKCECKFTRRIVEYNFLQSLIIRKSRDKITKIIV